MGRKNNLVARRNAFDEMPGAMLDRRDKRVVNNKGADHNPGNSLYRRPGSEKK